MDNSKKARFARSNRRALNQSASVTKKCYVIGCENPVIRAHSISNTRLLLKLSDDGEVMYFDKGNPEAGKLVKTGRGTATTFGGFCGDHDKIFHPIDNEDFTPGDRRQEYLFALRAAAKEFNTRETVGHLIQRRLDGETEPEFSLDEPGTEMMKMFQEGFDIGTRDQILMRGIFTNTLINRKYNVIETVIITIDEELPLAVSSAFNPELAPDGTLLNDVSPEGFGKRMKPWFISVFPQNGKTYCLVSYFRRDRRDFAFLAGVVDADDAEKQVVVSNLITSYVENFVANPTHWNSLNSKTQEIYNAVFGNSFKTEYAPFIANEKLNLFPSAQ